MSFVGESMRNASLIYGLILSVIGAFGSFISLGFAIYYFAMKCKDIRYSSCFYAAAGMFILFGVVFKNTSALLLGILIKQPTEIKKFLVFAIITNIIGFSTTIMIIKAIPLQGYDVASALAPNLYVIFTFLKFPSSLAQRFYTKPEAREVLTLIFTFLNCMVYYTYETMKEELKSEGEGVAGDVENSGGVADNKEELNLAVVPASKP